MDMLQLCGGMRNKKSLEQEINEFLEKWNSDELCKFFHNIIPLVELFNVDEDNDWVKDIVGEENEQNVRLIRTVYLLSRIADFHAAILSGTKVQFKDLYKRMEKVGIVEVEHEE